MGARAPRNSWRLHNASGHTPGYTLKEKGLDTLIPDRGWRLLVNASVKHVSGPPEVHGDRDQLVVVCLVRDGEPYVDAFVEHYRSLGVKHVVFLDNGSEDDTVPRARRHEGVTVLRTGLPYKQYSLLMKQYLIGRFGPGKWTLCVDIDELFDYPYSDVVGLGSFLGYLNSKGYTAVTAHMLDMFPEGPVARRKNHRDKLRTEEHRFYDLSDIRKQDYDSVWRASNTLTNEAIGVLRGGVRKNLFEADAVLTKHPLVFTDGGAEAMVNSSHRVRGARIADVACVLLHYKFVGRFYEYVVRAVREENYSNLSKRYKQYLRILDQNPHLQAKSPNSRELTSTNDLVDVGFLTVSEDYLKLVRAKEREADARLADAGPAYRAESFARSRERERSRAAETRRLEQQLGEERRETERLNLLIQNLHNALAERDPEGWMALRRQNARLEKEMESIRASRVWRLVNVLSRIKSSIPGVRKL